MVHLFLWIDTGSDMELDLATLSLDEAPYGVHPNSPSRDLGHRFGGRHSLVEDELPYGLNIRILWYQLEREAFFSQATNR